MKAGRTIALIAAAILILFGVLFLWGSFGPQGKLGWIAIGGISIAAGLGLIWFTRRQELRVVKTEIVQRIELSGDIELESIKCQFCGGPLSSNNIDMVAGAPVVNCPFCGSSYQITEAPKW